MYKSETKRVARVAASAVISMALAVGTAGVAFADGSHHGHSQIHHSHEGRHIGFSGVVTALTAATLTTPLSFTLQGRDGGAPALYTTSSTTTYFLDEAPATAAALAVGDRVHLQLSNTTPQTVLKVSIEVPSFEGRVLSVTASATTSTAIVSITGHDGWPTRTVDVTSSTTFVEAGSPATLANITVGSDIRAIGSVDASGVLTASLVMINAPEMFNAGTVTSVTPPTPIAFTVQPRDGGTPVAYTTSAATTYYVDHVATTAASLAVGDQVRLLLSATTPPTVVSVVIEVPSFEGKVLSVTTASSTSAVLSITGHDGATARTVDVTSSTTFIQGGVASTLASVVVGSEIKVTGTVDSTGVITALVIKISGGHSHNRHDH